MTATLAASTAILKRLYPTGEVPEAIQADCPGWMLIQKDSDFEGEDMAVPIVSESTVGAAADFATAQANLGQAAYRRFLLTRVEVFSLARVTGQALRAARKNAGALVNLWEHQMKMAMKTALKDLGVAFYGDGTAQRGTISTVTGTTITLTTPSACVNFQVGMRIVVAATSTGALRSGSSVISAIDRVAGTLTTASASWAADIPLIANSDVIFRQGDAPNNSGSLYFPTGLSSWLVGGSSPGTLFGLNRTVDAVRLAGQNYNASGVQMDEALIEGAARAHEQQEAPNLVLCHPRDYANLVKTLGGKVRYDTSDTALAKLGFRALAVDAYFGELKIVADSFCPRNTAFLIDKGDYRFKGLDKAPQILDFDSNQFLRVGNADAYECRIGTYGQFAYVRPSSGVRITNWGL